MVERGQYEMRGNHLTIYDGVEKIKTAQFLCQKIVEIDLPNSLIEIEKDAFKDNDIEELTLPSSLQFIGEDAFYNNELKGCLTIPNGINIIGHSVFRENKLSEIIIGSNVKEIWSYAFFGNLLLDINIPSGVEYIDRCAFSSNKIENVVIPNTVLSMGAAAFKCNSIKNLKLSENMKIIKQETFCYNELQEVIIPTGVVKIENSAFKNNRLQHINLPNSLVEIEYHAFKNNLLTYVKIPNSVKKIGIHAFDSNLKIEYKGHIYDEKFLKSKGCDSIVRASKILEIKSDFNFDNIKLEIMEIIPIDNDSIKGYANNYRKFYELTNELRLENYGFLVEYIDIFKMCYTLGLFHTNLREQEIVVDTIKKLMRIYNIDDIHEMYTDIEISKYKKKFKEIMINEYDNPKLKFVIAKLYNECEEITKAILKSRKEKIGILNAQNKVNYSEELTLRIEQLKKMRKEITIDDIYNYISNHILELDEETKELNDIIQILSIYITQEQMYKIKTLFAKSKQVKCKIFECIKEEAEYHYEWLSGDSPYNIILGYLCNCCAKFGGVGSDIMIQSMINPNIKNLVVYDSTNNIIGKSTAFYNSEEKYIVFNNIEMSKSFIEKSKTTANKREVLKAFLRGIRDQVEIMNKKDCSVEQVRIGMDRNDLAEEIANSNIPVVYENLLVNYPYKNYNGDADVKQAIIKIK